MDPVKTQTFFLEVRDDECIALQSALTARMHTIGEVIRDPNTPPAVRDIMRNSFTRLNLLRSRLLTAFSDPAMRG